MNDLLDNNSTPQDPEYLKLLEQAKADPEKVAKRVYDAGKYVDMLTRQKDEMRDAYLQLQEEANSKVTRSELETLLGQYSKRDLTSNTTPVKEETPVKPSLDPASSASVKNIEEIVTSHLSKLEDTKKRQENFSIVRNKLIEKYGDNYSTSLKQQLDLLEMSSSELTELAERNPKLVLKTLGLDKDQQQSQTRDFFTPPRPQQSFAPSPPALKDWDYYNNMRKQDPRKWMSREVQLEMHNSALALGDKFETPDYHRYEKDARVRF